MARKEKTEDFRTCSMCTESFDWHCLNNRHEPFMCRCRFHKWSRFLYSTGDVCAHFSSRHEYRQKLIDAGIIDRSGRNLV